MRHSWAILFAVVLAGGCTSPSPTFDPWLGRQTIPPPGTNDIAPAPPAGSYYNGGAAAPPAASPGPGTHYIPPGGTFAPGTQTNPSGTPARPTATFGRPAAANGEAPTNSSRSAAPLWPARPSGGTGARVERDDANADETVVGGDSDVIPAAFAAENETPVRAATPTAAVSDKSEIRIVEGSGRPRSAGRTLAIGNSSRSDDVVDINDLPAARTSPSTTHEAGHDSFRAASTSARSTTVRRATASSE